MTKQVVNDVGGASVVHLDLTHGCKAHNEIPAHKEVPTGEVLKEELETIHGEIEWALTHNADDAELNDCVENWLDRLLILHGG